MNTLPYILFCESPVERNTIDPDFEAEFLSAKTNGFETLVVNFEELTSAGNVEKATRRIPPVEHLTPTIYRGWMLTPDQYSTLYDKLLSKNFQLVNTAIEYQNCHYLPDSLTFIGPFTPRTVFEKFTGENSLDRLLEQAKIFGANPVIIKDYVKSEKHDWDTACFVGNAADTTKLKQSIENLLELRGKYLNEGIVIREFIALNELTIHSKSGMPLAEEYRLFFGNQKLIGVYNYWEEGDYEIFKPDTAKFEKMAETIDSQFFSMDIARQKNGDWIIIELGDGQVSGLPEHLDKNDFYSKLRNFKWLK